MMFRLPLSRLALVPVLAGGLFAATAPAPAADAALSRPEIEKIVHDYIVEHPEVVEEAMAALDKKHNEQIAEQQKTAIADKAAMIFDSPNQVVLGNPKGDVTLVEFFDYNCGFCKQALPDMLGLLNEDKNLRFVLKEFPVLSAGSEEAARVAIAVNRIAPDKYMEFHKRLLGGRGPANKQKALDVVAEIGLDKAKIELASNDIPTVLPALQETRVIAEGLGLNGTPSYVVGRSVIPGAIGIDRLKQKIAEVRNTCTADGGVKPC
ncbi:MAG: DsbA family protein [Ancalomicrobiaceae bacterium]|nr:DsbA family protein [Ancalomicrobiaceae bacterium]